MENENTLMDKTKKPTAEMVADSLGKTYPLWESILQHIEANYGKPVEEWKMYGSKYGWTRKTLLKKRNLFFLGARKNWFLITFVFGDKAVNAIEKNNFPEKLKIDLLNEKKYMEGRVLSVNVKTKKDADLVKRLIDIKIEN